MAKKPSTAKKLWSIIGLLLILTFVLVIVRGALAIRSSWKDVLGSSSAHVVEAQAMTYSEDELLEETTPEEESTTEDTEQEEEKTTIGDMIDKKGEDIANVINAETGLALTGGSVLIAIAVVFFVKK